MQHSDMNEPNFIKSAHFHQLRTAASDYVAHMRHNRMLQVIDNLYDIPKPSTLDVGGGSAYLLDYCRRKKVGYTLHRHGYIGAIHRKGKRKIC